MQKRFECLKTVFLYHFHHIDDWPRSVNYPSPVVEGSDTDPHKPDPPVPKEIAAILLRQVGWEGDGMLQLCYLPPFCLPSDDVRNDAFGCWLWHVKQSNNGTSFICSDISLAGLTEQLWESEVCADLIVRLRYKDSSCAFIDEDRVSRKWSAEC